MSMTSTVDDFITTLQQSIAQIQQSREKVPKKLTSTINELARKFIKLMSKEAGNFLHKELDDDKHTEDQVKAVIDLFPDSLSQVDKDGYLPIQKAARSEAMAARSEAISGARSSSVTFVPLMAREGYRLGVGGEGQRGGLLALTLTTPNGGYNTIQILSSFACIGGDNKITQVLENLRGMNLLKRVDIEEYGLLTENVLHPNCQRRFEFFSNWDPDALGARDSRWAAPIHIALYYDNNTEEIFEMALKAGMKHFPERLGFLFHKLAGITACKRSFDKLGVDSAMNIIRRCIPPSDSHLILHHAFRHEPTLVDDFAQFYPDAAFLRDANGHTFSQIKSQNKFHTLLRKGKRTFKKNSLFFIEATDDQLSTVDPKTGLHPFMLAAADNKSDLAAIYYLLKKNPKLVESGSHEKNAGNDSDEAKNSRKRQRDGISTLSI